MQVHVRITCINKKREDENGGKSAIPRKMERFIIWSRKNGLKARTKVLSSLKWLNETTRTKTLSLD